MQRFAFNISSVYFSILISKDGFLEITVPTENNLRKRTKTIAKTLRVFLI